MFIPIYILHHSTDYWEDPEEFIPERYDNSNNHDLFCIIITISLSFYL